MTIAKLIFWPGLLTLSLANYNSFTLSTARNGKVSLSILQCFLSSKFSSINLNPKPIPPFTLQLSMQIIEFRMCKCLKRTFHFTSPPDHNLHPYKFPRILSNSRCAWFQAKTTTQADSRADKACSANVCWSSRLLVHPLFDVCQLSLPHY